MESTPIFSKLKIQLLIRFGADHPCEVNMQLSGDMLATIKKLNSSNGKIKISIDDGTGGRKKKSNNMTGMKGHPTLAGKVPVRNWFWMD